MLTADEGVASRAEQLVSLLVRMYGDGLSRIADGIGRDKLSELAADKVVAGLLVLHDLHPEDVLTRVEKALDSVRPYLGSHAGGVEFIGVSEEGVAQLRLQGSCDGCPASTVTVKTAIEGAILEAAPEIVGVHVEGVAAETKEDPNLLQIGRKSKPSTVEIPRSWVELDGPLPGPGTLEERAVAGMSLLLAATASHTYAYRRDCPMCGSGLASGTLTDSIVACPQCGQRYDLAAAGRSIDDGVFLEPVPLLAENGAARVSIPGGVA